MIHWSSYITYSIYIDTKVFLSGSSTDSTVTIPACNPRDSIIAYVWTNYTSNSTAYAFTIFTYLILNQQVESCDTVCYQHLVVDLTSVNGDL
jgi:hypothetical protein